MPFLGVLYSGLHSVDGPDRAEPMTVVRSDEPVGVVGDGVSGKLRTLFILRGLLYCESTL